MKVIPCEDKTELYCHYSGQISPQNAYIAIDLRDGTIWATYNGEIGNAVPMDVWNGLTHRYCLPFPVYAESVNKCMEELVPKFEELQQNFEEIWDGSNWVGKLTDKGIELSEEIEKFIENNFDEEYDAIKVVDASDYLYGENLGITKDTTDAELAEIAEDLQNNSDIDIMYGIEEFLESVRENADD